MDRLSGWDEPDKYFFAISHLPFEQGYKPAINFFTEFHLFKAAAVNIIDIVYQHTSANVVIYEVQYQGNFLCSLVFLKSDKAYDDMQNKPNKQNDVKTG